MVPTIRSASLVRMDEFLNAMAQPREAGAVICGRGFMQLTSRQIEHHPSSSKQEYLTGVRRAENLFWRNASCYVYPAE